MFTLRVLGCAVLEGDTGPLRGRAAHKRRLALLALLAAAPTRTLSRDRVVGYLWPDHPPERARHLLSESLYVLRKELGEDAFVATGDDLALHSAVLAVDLWDFEDALTQGDLERAVALYRGPFLDGFYVGDAPEWERWAEAARNHLAREYANALKTLAEVREQDGDWEGAVKWWQRLAAHDPYNSRVALRFMQALDATGERAAAIRHAGVYAALLREDRIEPDAEIEALAETLRTAPAGTTVSGSDSTASTVRVETLTAGPPLTPSDAPDTFRAGGGVEGSSEGETAKTGAGKDTEIPLPRSGHPREWLRPKRAVRVAALLALATMLGGIALTTFLRRSDDQVSGAANLSLEPNRIAVLYFDDHSPQQDLGYLANGLTESLIHELSQVEALDVISRNGVKPYRAGDVPLDSIVRVLRVGSVVEGSIQRSGDELRLVVQLIDASTGVHLESRTLHRSADELFALQDDLADEVARFLRKRLGREVRLRERNDATQSVEARALVFRAEELRDHAAQLAADTAAATRMATIHSIQLADSLLQQAEKQDPRWGEPTVLRGWLLIELQRLVPKPARIVHLREAIHHAERSLQMDPNSPRALELRGVARWILEQFVSTPAVAERLREGAERDLRRALTFDSSLAMAWSTLSQVLRFKGNLAEADLAAQRALSEDAYLSDANEIVERLYRSTLALERYSQAEQWCKQGGEAWPDDRRFLDCRLTLLALRPDRRPEPESASVILRRLQRLDPPEKARSEGRPYSPIYREMMLAAVLARAQQEDSARAILARARAAASRSPDLRSSLLYDEAYVLLLLEDRNDALAALEQFLALHPHLKSFIARDPRFRALRGTEK